MSPYNYVVSANKPTSVTHSCAGNFTGAGDSNLIVAKCTRIEIHLLSPQGLQLMLDVPVYGRIVALELFRPRGETQDLLFMFVERQKFSVLQWNAETAELITRASENVFKGPTLPSLDRIIGIIDPDCRLIGVHSREGLFKVIPLDIKCQPKRSYSTRFDERKVRDMKFLYGCPNPTVVILYQNKKNHCNVKTYEVSLRGGNFVKGPWSYSRLRNGPELLVPVPPPLCGVLVIGRGIAYCSASAFIQLQTQYHHIKTCARIGAVGYQYLLGDCNGDLHRLDLTHTETIARVVPSLETKLLGKTSIASSISYIDDSVIFVGSKTGDSQLIKLRCRRDVESSCVEVLKSYVNMGPISDFLEHEPGQGKVITCSGAYKDGSLRIVQYGIVINEQGSVQIQGITGMWSLRSATNDPHDTFLVVSFIGETRCWAMNPQDKLEETEIEGFDSNVQTLFCHDALHDQLVQVTSDKVRLVSSTTKKLRDEWSAPAGHSVNVATANASQVLLASTGRHLFCLQIGDCVLREVNRVELEYEISCIDVTPVGDDPYFSQIAAVGMWTDNSVGIFTLPDLNLVTKEHLGGEIVPRSVLFCSFDGICYLLCALGDGHLITFALNASNGELTDRKKVCLGTQPVTLRTFSWTKATYVFAASERSTVIYSGNKKLLYTNIAVKQVTQMCSFNSSALPESLAIAHEDELIIGIIDDMKKQLCIRSIPIGEQPQRISHQQQSRSFAICSFVCKDDTESHFVRLLDDQTFVVRSTYPLRRFEKGSSLLSCSFADDKKVYCIVGTAHVVPGATRPVKGRILVFDVEKGELQLIAERETEGAVYSLDSFNGKLLAAKHDKIQLYKWMLNDDHTGELQAECSYEGFAHALSLQTRGNVIVVGDRAPSVTLLIYQSEGTIELIARSRFDFFMTAVEILDFGIQLSADLEYNLVTFRATEEESGSLRVVGEYHLGQFINRFRKGSPVMRLSDSNLSPIPTVLFGTDDGVIGVIASLPHEEYEFLEKLQKNLRKAIKGVGGLGNWGWRSYYNSKDHIVRGTLNFLDGDLIESFLDLSRNKAEEISEAMNVPIEELTERVKDLITLKFWCFTSTFQYFK